MPVWVGVGGSPESVVRVVRHDLQLMLAIIGGDPRRFRPYVDLYHRACAQMGRQVKPVGIHSPGHVAATDELAAEQLWPHYKAMFDRIGAERGWPPVTPDRFMGDMKYATGPMPHEQLCDSIRLYGEKVIPMVKELVAGNKIAAQ
jgi:alkanesulfonate monooxygenase SsuD/methylene tetrahydromethanopterin reductase-like flavin-dependent oxidoreductase (luciferase family)